MKKEKTSFQEKVDSELWKQFCGLAKFLQVTKAELLERAMREIVGNEFIELEKK